MKLMFRMALRNMIRSPGKFVFRGVILFVLMVVVFISVSTRTGASKGMDDARKRFGTEVRLEPKTGETAGGQDGGTADTPVVTAALADRLLESRYVTGHNYSLWAPVASDMRLPAFQSERVKVAPSSKTGEAARDVNRFILAGSSSPASDPYFTDGALRLISGSFPRETGAGENTGGAVISRLLAEENGLSVGSVFTIYSPDLKIKKELKVAGTFDWYNGSDISFALDVGRIFVPLGLVREFSGGASPGVPADVLTYASYFLDSPQHLNGFIAEAGPKGLDMEKFRLRVNDGRYIEATGQLQRLKVLSGLILAAILVLGAALMTLSSLSLAKKRKAEMGLLRTMGAGKRDLLLLYLSEILIVGLFALAAAAPAGALAAPAASGAFFREQIRVTDNIDRNSIIVYIMESDSDSAIPYTGINGNLQESHVIDRVETVAGPIQVALFLAAGFFVILCGALAAAWKVLRHDPADPLKGEGGRA